MTCGFNKEGRRILVMNCMNGAESATRAIECLSELKYEFFQHPVKKPEHVKSVFNLQFNTVTDNLQAVVMEANQ